MLVSGRGRVVNGVAEMTALRQRYPSRPWAGGKRDAWVCLEPSESQDGRESSAAPSRPRDADDGPMARR
ncbi:hypothetical protein GCM10022402_28150 [Salinactinospora qingdaonensis]|uniref:Uncharacterized protein n=1 Tax=Salinactinospora qingdaonensis TaxID=702744 RepID=A0ABP7FVQ8_9ACTN